MATEKDKMLALAMATAFRFGDRRIVDKRFVERWFEQYWRKLNIVPQKAVVPTSQFENKPRVRKI